MRWVIRIGVALAVLVLLAFGLLAMVPSERVAAVLSAQFETMTGRKMTLTGEVSPRMWPSLGISTGPVSIANAEWATGEEPLFSAQSLSVDINFGALFGGEVKVVGVNADQPEFNLERAADGRQNWVFGASEAGEAGAVPAAATAFTMDAGTITDGSIRFVDKQADKVIALDGVDATLSIPDYSGPFTLTASGSSGGQGVALDLSGDVFSAFAAGRVVPLTVSLAAGRSTIGFNGRGGVSPLVADGALVADLSDLAALGGLIGTDLAQPGLGLGQERLSVSGKLTLDGSGAMFLRGAEIVADGNQITGDIDLAPGEARPMLKAQLVAGPLVIGTGEGGEAGGGTSGGMKADGWPEGDIDVSALQGMDAEVALSTPSLDLGVIRLGETKALITIERARAVIEIRQMAAYGGQVLGDFVVNGRGGLSVGGRLTLAGLETQPLLTDLAGWDRLISTGNLEVEFLGVGNSIAAIMASLKGQGTLELGQGELSGLDIAGMLATLDPTQVGDGQKTLFDAIAGTFSIDGGVLSNSDLKLVGPHLTASGSGEIGLGARTLDYRVRPTALADADGTGGVMVPLLITGPWADPKFRLDLEGIAREKMEEEARAAAKAAEAAAKAELERRLQEELGIVAGEGESLEDAARRRAEEALEEETRKALEAILGGN
jgi:AsmA protein